jgi:hypothetical protein
LESLGPILWDFSRRTMGFVRNGCRVFWTATPTSPGRTVLMATTPDLLDELLLQFTAIFEEPSGLSPERRQSHQICLLSGTPPVVVRPI